MLPSNPEDAFIVRIDDLIVGGLGIEIWENFDD